MYFSLLAHPKGHLFTLLQCVCCLRKTCCFSHVHAQHAPPCTFLPLDTIEAKPTNEALRLVGSCLVAKGLKLLPDAGSLGEVPNQLSISFTSIRLLSRWICFCVSYSNMSPPLLQRALQYACGNAVVCDTMEEARKVAFGGSERRKVWKLATLSAISVLGHLPYLSISPP